MHTINIFIFIGLAIAIVNTQTCKESPKALCSHPKPHETDFKWLQANQPEDGWHMELGNSAIRLHFAELIQGKLLTYDDDYSNMCGRARFEHSDTSIDGKLYGFGGKKATYRCYPLKTEEGASECDWSSVGLSKYVDASISYETLFDNNFFVAIFCFANGESGWISMSKTKSLTEKEKRTILDHVKTIGYDTTDVVTLYDSDTCTDNTVDASYFVREQVRPSQRRFRNRQRSRYYGN